MGIRMGTPLHEVHDILKKENTTIFSANFTLYGDMSRRIMQTAQQFSPNMEIYSIDEAFMALDHIPKMQHTSYAHHMKKTLEQWTGIPVSIGIAPTKTLAKTANEIAKKHPQYQGVLTFGFDTNIEEWLASVDVTEIWGIGSKLGERLNKYGIYTARELIELPDQWIKKKLSISGLRTVYELRGIPCFGLHEEKSLQQSITSSRSFGKPVSKLSQLQEAVATYTARAAEKLREQNAHAGTITVYIRTSPFRKTEAYYSNSKTMSIPIATNNTSRLITYAHQLLKNMYKPNLNYKKAGITLGNITSTQEQQLNLLDQPETPHSQAAMIAMDSLNKHYGTGTVKIASEGIQKQWYMKTGHRSPRYTTDWNELPRVKC